MKIFDLTMPINNRTPSFPEDPKQEIKQFATIEKDGWNEKRISFNSHFSTHIDAPFHMLAEGKKLDEFPIKTFIGKAIVLDVRGQKEIKVDLNNIKKDDIVLFCTNHSKKLYSEDFFENNPVLSRKTAEELVKKKVRIVGMDSFSPDNPPYEIHKILMRKNILILENLVNLEQLLGKQFTCYVMPLKIEEADGAPCRVIAVID